MYKKIISTILLVILCLASNSTLVLAAVPPLSYITVTINQLDSQVDPTAIGSSIKFRTIFYPAIAVETFTAEDIDTSASTATGVAVTNIEEVSPNDGTTFDVTVTTTGVGNVILSIPTQGDIFSSSNFYNGVPGANSVVADSAGNIYVANYASDTVTKITPAGASTVFGATGNSPSSIAIDSVGNIYTANSGSNNITKITPAGASTVFGATGSGPMALTIDSADNIYIANVDDSTVTKITSAGVSSLFAITGNGPIGITKDALGNIYTVNQGDDTVYKITPEGAPSLFASTGSWPLAITIDSLGNLYTANSGSNDVSKITPAGVSSILASTGATPNSITVDSVGNLYTTDQADNTVSRITQAGNYRLISSLAASPSNITIDSLDNIYVVNGGDGTITKIIPTGIESSDYIKYNEQNSSSVDNKVKVINTLFTVDIEKAPGQLDSTVVGVPIKFRATFSKAIDEISFTANDVDISSSTASGVVVNSIVEVVPNNGTTFDITVMTTGAGTVVLSIPGYSNFHNTSNVFTSGLSPYSIVMDSVGNVYSANYASSNVSKITSAGVSSILGTTGLNPIEIAVDSIGNVYTVNEGDNTISKITPAGVSSIFGEIGSAPLGIVVDSDDNVYVINSGDNTISKITPSGVSTVIGATGSYPIAITIDLVDNIYIANANDSTVYKMTPGGAPVFFANTGAYPKAITVDSSGIVYTINNDDSDISKITPAGESTVFSGEGFFSDYKKITTDNSGNVYVSNVEGGRFSSTSNVIKITPDGISDSFSLVGSIPLGIITDSVGNVYTANSEANTISKITPEGVATIFGATGLKILRMAMDSNSNFYSYVGNGSVFKINQIGSISFFGSAFDASGEEPISFGPSSIAVDHFDNVYVANQTDDSVSKITPDGVSTIFAETGARPIAITVDSAGNLYTANNDSDNVSKITPIGVSTILGVTGVNPVSIAVDSAGNVYTVNSSDNNVSKITPAGVSTILGTVGTSPQEIIVDSSSNIYVLNVGDNNVSKITPAGLSTVLGVTGTLPQSITLDSASNIYTANYESYNFSKLSLVGETYNFANTAGEPSYIIIDSLDNIYLSTYTDGRVIKFSPLGVYNSDRVEHNVSNSTSNNNVVLVQYGSNGNPLYKNECKEVIYDNWQTTCVNNVQYRSYLGQSPKWCKLTDEQIAAAQRPCSTTSNLDNNPTGHANNIITTFYKEGTLLKSRLTNKIYIIASKVLKYISNLASLSKYRGRPIITVDQNTIDALAKQVLNYKFTRNLKLGDVNNDVKELQKYLNNNGFTVSKTGAGSSSNETNFFGPATKSALINFQKSKKINPANGLFGPLTRGRINK